MLLITGGRVIDVLRGHVEVSDWLVTDSGTLARPADAGVDGLANGCTKLTAEGEYLLPGLIDAHVHLGRPRGSVEEGATSTGSHLARVLAQTLAHGVTMVRDLGDRWPHGAEVAAAAKRFGGPHIVSALGGLTAPRGYGIFLGEAVSDDAELLAAIARHHRSGASFVKLFLTGTVDFTTGLVGPMQFNAATVELAARAAHDRGLGLAVHANGPQAVMAAVRAGADTVEHGILISQAALQAMHERGTVWVPTLTPLFRALQRAQVAGDEGSARTVQALGLVFERHRESVARAFEMGIDVVAGTDAGSTGVPHGLLSDEIELMVAAGVSPMKAIKSATVTAAEALRAAVYGGAIESGRRADLVILRSNPLQDVRALREVSKIVCAGKVIEGPVAFDGPNVRFGVQGSGSKNGNISPGLNV